MSVIKAKLKGLPTWITEQLVLHNDLVDVKGLWVHVIVLILVSKVEQNLEKKRTFRSSLPSNEKKDLKLERLSHKQLLI